METAQRKTKIKHIKLDTVKHTRNYTYVEVIYTNGSKVELWKDKEQLVNKQNTEYWIWSPGLQILNTEYDKWSPGLQIWSRWLQIQ